MPLTDLLTSHGFLSLLSNTAQDQISSQGWFRPKWADSLTSIINQENVPQTFLQKDLVEGFFSIDSRPIRLLFVLKVTSHHTLHKPVVADRDSQLNKLHIKVTEEC